MFIERVNDYESKINQKYFTWVARKTAMLWIKIKRDQGPDGFGQNRMGSPLDIIEHKVLKNT